MCSLLNGNNRLGLPKHQFNREMRVCMVRRTFLSAFFVVVVFFCWFLLLFLFATRFIVHEAVFETPTQNIFMVTLCSLLIWLVFSSASNYMNSLLFDFLCISKFPAVWNCGLCIFLFAVNKSGTSNLLSRSFALTVAVVVHNTWTRPIVRRDVNIILMLLQTNRRCG